MKQIKWLVVFVGTVVGWGLAQDYQNLEWGDDGSVTLITEDDGERITIPADDIGTMFGPGETPFENVNIAVTVDTGGLKGGISGPLHQLRPAWEELTDATLDIVEIPLPEQLHTTMNDLQLGLNQFDGFIEGAWYMGEYVTPGFTTPVDDYIADARFPQWDPEWFSPSLEAIYQWDGEY